MNPERMMRLLSIAGHIARDHDKVELNNEGALYLRTLLEKNYDKLHEDDKDQLDVMIVNAIILSYNEAKAESAKPATLVNQSLN